MAESQNFRQSDFTGGLFEATSAGDFTDRQLSRMYGLVLEGEVSLRSQPPVQTVGDNVPSVTFTALRTFMGRTHNWLLAFDTSGALWYTQAPSDDATTAVVNGVDWAVVSGSYSDTAQRFLCPVPGGTDATSYHAAYLINNPSLSSNPAYIVGENAAGTAIVVVKEWTSRFAGTTVSGSENVANVDVMPHASLGVMWGDYLILGRVRWFKDAASRLVPMTESTTVPFPNAIWVSATPAKLTGPDGTYQEFRIDQWHPSDVWASLVPADAELLDLRVIDAGLLILHTQGATLVRGLPPGTTTSNPFKPDAITAVGGARYDATAHNARSTFWAEGGTTVWVEARGSVWETNGADVGRLDQYLHLGENPAATAYDTVCAVGPWLVLARGGRMFCLRRFENDGAWSELNPGGTNVRGLEAIGFCLYYIVGGKVKRMPFTADAGRGLIDGVAFDQVIASATLASADPWSRKLWFRVGVVASSGVSAGTVQSVSMLAGPALQLPRPAEFTAVLAQPLGQRSEVVVPAGIGAAEEAAVEVVFRGDVRVEALFADVRGRHPKR